MTHIPERLPVLALWSAAALPLDRVRADDGGAERSRRRPRAVLVGGRLRRGEGRRPGRAHRARGARGAARALAAEERRCTSRTPPTSTIRRCWPTVTSWRAATHVHRPAPGRGHRLARRAQSRPRPGRDRLRPPVRDLRRRPVRHRRHPGRDRLRRPARPAGRDRAGLLRGGGDPVRAGGARTGGRACGRSGGPPAAGTSRRAGRPVSRAAGTGRSARARRTVAADPVLRAHLEYHLPYYELLRDAALRPE